MTDTTGWHRCDHGKLYKEFGNYRFRLFNHHAGWSVDIEYIDRPMANTLNEAKELASRIVRRLTPEDAK